jgi:WD40 repeat protein
VEALNFSLDSTIIIWRLRDGFSRDLTAFDFYPRSVRLSPDGQYFTSGDRYGNILIRDVRTGNLVVRWRGHDEYVTSLVFSPDGQSLLSGSWDCRVKQWDISFLSSPGMANPPVSGMMEISRLNGHTVC